MGTAPMTCPADLISTIIIQAGRVLFIHQSFLALINDQIKQGNIRDATQVICVQQGLYHVREVIGLSVSYSSPKI